MYSILFTFECGHQRPARKTYEKDQWTEATKAADSWRELMTVPPVILRCDECGGGRNLQGVEIKIS